MSTQVRHDARRDRKAERELETEEAPDQELHGAQPARDRITLHGEDQFGGEGDGEDEREEGRRTIQESLDLRHEPRASGGPWLHYPAGTAGLLPPATFSSARIRSPIGGWVSHSDFARSSNDLIGLTM